MQPACLPAVDRPSTPRPDGRHEHPGRRRRRASIAAALLVSGAFGITACGSDADDNTASTTTAAPPAVSVAKTPVKVAQTERGAVGYRSVGSGPALVMIMGFGSSMEDWQPSFVDDLAKTHRVVIFDNAGIGKSDPLKSTVKMAGMADQTSALIDELGLGKPDVLGWSMGGMVAQSLALRHPDQVSHLVLSATQPGNGEAKVISKKAAKAVAESSAEEFLAALFPDDQKAALKAYSDGLSEYTDRSTVPDGVYGPQRAAINGWIAGDEPDGAKASAATFPVLAAHGKDDIFIPASNTTLLAKLYPNAERQLYDDAGHAFLFQADTGYVSRVNAFLSKDG